MEIDGAKENIQPLAAGRDISILQAFLGQSSPQELLAQRRQLEDAIRNYEGEDPLEPWYTYVCWIEQSCPSGGKESGLMEVLAKCLSYFEKDKRYYQDRRMIKLYIKFIESNKEPLECYQQLFSAGIGTMVADFYIAWAYCYDICGNHRKAEEIFRHGISCHAEPLEVLQEAHRHFGYSIAQRFIYGNDEEKSAANKELEERRYALTSLRGLRKKGKIGSIRTGAVVKSINPGKIDVDQTQSSLKMNKVVEVFRDENIDPQVPLSVAISEDKFNEERQVRTDGASVVRSIIDATRNQENLKEPGPWNKAHDKKNLCKLFSKKATKLDPGFQIHVDEEMPSSRENLKSVPLVVPITGGSTTEVKPFIYLENFTNKNKKQEAWNVPVTTEVKPDENTIPQYEKYFMYPRPNKEFQLEEYRAYKYFAKRNESNDFTKERDPFWKNDANAGIRMYPHFAKSSSVQKSDELDKFFAPPKCDGLVVCYEALYNTNDEMEYQNEELLAMKYLKRINQTIISSTDMEETVCLTSDMVKRRKSFFPNRISFAPSMFGKIEESFAMQECSPTKPIPSDEVSTNERSSSLTGIRKDVSQCKEKVVIEKVEVLERKDLNLESVNKDTEISSKSAVAPLPFQIYTDKSESNSESRSPKDSISNILTKEAETAQGSAVTALPFQIYTDNIETSFEFKLPSIPPVTALNPKASKIPIKTNNENDPNVLQRSKSAVVGFLDGEETCSTQTFNIYLKGQLVSTPKAPQKTTSVRQFGTILKDDALTPPPQLPVFGLESVEVQGSPETDDVQANSGTSSLGSPQRKQLSTILETSEHGTTQGTTGSHVSTKSTISSSENDENIVKPQILRSLETLPEATNESLAVTNSRSEEISTQLQNTRITNTSNVTLSTKSHPQTPGMARILDAKSKTEIQVLPTTKDVGNFTRLEEREDTEHEFQGLRGIRFPEEKTDTISKFMLTSRQDLKLNDEKTETLTKLYYPTAPLKFEDEKTTETVPKIAFEVPRALATGLSNDSFSFLVKTPVKTVKAKNLSQDPSTPLMGLSAKRFCDIDTPEMVPNRKTAGEQNVKKTITVPTITIFDDEDMPLAPATSVTKSSAKSENPLEIPFKDQCFERSLSNSKDCEERKQLESSPKPETEDHLRKSQMLPSQHCNSFLPEISFRQDLKPGTNNSKVSFCKNVSVIPDSQAEKDISYKSRMNQKASKDSSFIPDSQPAGVNSIKWLKKSNNPEGEESSHLLESFMKDFNSIKQQSPSSNKSSGSKAQNTLKFLSESLNKMKDVPEIHPFLPSVSNKKEIKSHEESTETTPKASSNEKFFELNAETEMFMSGNSMIKNSTWLPGFDNLNYKPSDIQEKSLHIKTETPSQYIEKETNAKTNSIDLIVDRSSSEIAAPKLLRHNQNEEIAAKHDSSKYTKSSLNLKAQDLKLPSLNDSCEKSIYYKQTPKTPTLRQISWENESDTDDSDSNEYVHNNVDLDYTIQKIDNMRVDPNVNPFCVDLINAFLDNIQFISSCETLPNCELIRKGNRLKHQQKLSIKGIQFEVEKLIGQGAYGAVYRGKESLTGIKCAFKQERPPNYWEYYICLEIRKRLKIGDLYPAFMSIDYALIANNCSIFVSQLSEYGSIISVANTIKKHTGKNINEYVVMYFTCELLSILDHLHAIEIIHADVKPDNVLLMKKLCYSKNEFSLQLIDFGVAIDMKFFKPNQTFNYIYESDDFKCIEMREKRSWTYQIDLYGLASIIHVMLFGKYMEVEKKLYWMPKTHVPRYFNKSLWETIFKTLLNIHNCNSMPNLQHLRTLIKEEISMKEKYVIQAIQEFNNALK